MHFPKPSCAMYKVFNPVYYRLRLFFISLLKEVFLLFVLKVGFLLLFCNAMESCVSMANPQPKEQEDPEKQLDESTTWSKLQSYKNVTDELFNSLQPDGNGMIDSQAAATFWLQNFKVSVSQQSLARLEKKAQLSATAFSLGCFLLDPKLQGSVPATLTREEYQNAGFSDASDIKILSSKRITVFLCILLVLNIVVGVS